MTAETGGSETRPYEFKGNRAGETSAYRQAGRRYEMCARRGGDYS
jgi:hypothetical protein